jgi:hypothetical protein
LKLHAAFWAALFGVSCPAQIAAAKTSDPLYRLPESLTVDPIASYGETGDSDPAPRRGIVLQGYRYDAHEGPDWKTVEMAKQAEQCGERLKLPSSIYHSGDPDQPVVANFWLLHTPPEALVITRHATLILLEDCIASVNYSLEVDRLFFNANHVTEFNWRGGKWGTPATLPTKGYSHAASPFLPADNLDSLKKRYRNTAYRRPQAGLPDVRTICFGVGSSIDSIQQCHLDEPGPYRGLLLSRTMFHTSTYDRGLIVEQLKTDVLIDGRLFEWDREISLAK